MDENIQNNQTMEAMEEKDFNWTPVAIIVLILLLAGGFFWFFNNRAVSYEFSGNVMSIEGSEILVSGIYIFDNEEKSSENLGPKEVRVLVSEETIIKKTSFVIPLGRAMFKPSELPKETSVADMETLKDDAERISVGIKITSDKNIYNKKSFEAVEISYTAPVISGTQ